MFTPLTDSHYHHAFSLFHDLFHLFHLPLFSHRRISAHTPRLPDGIIFHAYHHVRNHHISDFFPKYHSCSWRLFFLSHHLFSSTVHHRYCLSLMHYFFLKSFQFYSSSIAPHTENFQLGGVPLALLIVGMPTFFIYYLFTAI